MSFEILTGKAVGSYKLPPLYISSKSAFQDLEPLGYILVHQWVDPVPSSEGFPVGRPSYSCEFHAPSAWGNVGPRVHVLPLRVCADPLRFTPLWGGAVGVRDTPDCGFIFL